MADLISDVPAEIGRAIRELRIAQGLSQGALAARMQSLGLTSWHQTTVAKVEAQKAPRTVSVQELTALAVALGVGSLDRFLTAKLEAGIFAASLDLMQARMKSALANVADSDIWAQAESDPEAQAAIETLRTSSAVLAAGVLDEAMSELKRKKMKDADLSRRPLSETLADALADEVDS